MASLRPKRGNISPDVKRESARILLLHSDMRQLSHYRSIFEELGCTVSATTSFAEGARWLAPKSFELVLLEQGSKQFEGHSVLAVAMELDSDLRVIVVAEPYEPKCCFRALSSGALDYLQAPLTKEQIYELLDTFVPSVDLCDGTAGSRR